MNWNEATWNNELNAMPRVNLIVYQIRKTFTYSLRDAIAKHTDKIK